MKMLLVGAVGMLALQVLLVGGYLAMSKQDPIILNPDSGSLEPDGITMAMLCGDNNTISDRPIDKVLDKVPPDGDVGAWTRGRTLQGDCNVFYHHSLLYNPHSNEALLSGLRERLPRTSSALSLPYSPGAWKGCSPQFGCPARPLELLH